MGKSHKLLTIVALPPCNTWEELWYLEQKGHTIVRLSPVEKGFQLQGVETHVGALRLFLDADIIIGENCWRMGPQHQKYLALALAEARMLKYKTSEKRKDKKEREQSISSITTDLEPMDEPGADDADTPKQS